MSQFWELFGIYKWSVLASITMATALAVSGGQWTARLKSAQIFVLGQGASLGVVLGLALNIFFGTDFHSLSLLGGLCVGAVTLLITDRFISTRADKNHIYLTLFSFYLALTYLISYVTPSLETHIAASYFGDLAVMSDQSALLSLALGLTFLIFALLRFRSLTLISFQVINDSWIHREKSNLAFDLGTLLITTASIQSMGYLFTIGSLFISTSFAAGVSRHLLSYLQNLVFISFSGTLVGFLVSLISPTLPTVPCILIGQMITGVLLVIFRRRRH